MTSARPATGVPSNRNHRQRELTRSIPRAGGVPRDALRRKPSAREVGGFVDIPRAAQQRPLRR